jgi:D-serine deaminase-like pyridoxal phosphate-dependent protein
MELDDLDTPSLVADLDRMERNINRMAKFTKECGVKLRPHVKTHKSPEIAKMQLAAGSTGVCLQKVSEVEVFANNGIRDIFLTNEVVVPDKLVRLALVAEKAHIGVAVDNAKVAKVIGKVFREVGSEVDVYADIDVGMGRCGARAEDAPEIAEQVHRQKNLIFKGLMGYEGHVNGKKTKEEQMKASAEAMKGITAAKKGIKKKGIAVDVVSVGSSVSTWINAKHPDVTEVQPGMYVFNDHVLESRGVATWNDLALTVVATVMSRPAEDRGVVDAGSKCFNFDTGLFPKSFARDGAVVDHFSEEHGWMQLSGPSKKLKIGDRMRLVPAHCCTTVNQHEEIFGIRGTKVDKVFPVLARGKMR